MAQTAERVIERLGIDRLELSGVGATYGRVKPTQIEGTSSFGVHADYGEVAPHWRIIFGATYWGSRYTQAAVRRFADSLVAAVDDPTGDGTANVGEVRVSAIALTAEGRWNPRRGTRRVRPYVGGTIGAYAMNAEGRGISGTFVEDALDTVSVGLGASTGLDVRLARNLSLGMQARYDLLSGARFGALRTGFTYMFRGAGA